MTPLALAIALFAQDPAAAPQEAPAAESAPAPAHPTRFPGNKKASSMELAFVGSA